jgi:ElaB/YqjD/DUF883 family membrane-anchored ribosome-binding protein
MLGEGYEAAMGQAAEVARDTLERLKAEASAAGAAAQRTASRIGEQVREAAESLLDEQKQRVAGAVHGLAEALRQASDTLEREQSGVAAHYADQAAAQIERLSETVRQQRLQDMLADAENFARRQPALFGVGAVAIGFLVGRLLSRPTRHASRNARFEAYAATGGESMPHAASVEPRGEAQGDTVAGCGSGAKAEPF